MSDSTPTDPWGNPLPEQGAPTTPGAPPPNAPTPPAQRPDAWWPGSGDQANPQQGSPQPGPAQPGWGQPAFGQQPIWGPEGQWVQPPQKTETTAITSLVLAIIGVPCCGIVLGPTAIALGLQARKKIRDSNGFLKGDGLAIAGIVVGIIALVLGIANLILVLSDPDLLDEFNANNGDGRGADGGG